MVIVVTLIILTLLLNFHIVLSLILGTILNFILTNFIDFLVSGNFSNKLIIKKKLIELAFQVLH